MKRVSGHRIVNQTSAGPGLPDLLGEWSVVMTELRLGNCYGDNSFGRDEANKEGNHSFTSTFHAPLLSPNAFPKSVALLQPTLINLISKTMEHIGYEQKLNLHECPNETKVIVRTYNSTCPKDQRLGICASYQSILPYKG